MSQEQSQSKMTKPIVGIAAIVALALGVWFGVKGIEQHQAAQELETAKQAIEAKITDNKTAEIAPLGDDVAFLLEMQLFNLQGEPQTVASQLADKVTLINFWATWCAPCREEMPIFNAIYQRHQNKGFGVLGLTIDNPNSTAAFIQQLGIVYPVLMAEDEGWDLLSKTGNPKNLMPYSFLIDQSGKVLETKLGPLHEKELEEWANKYL